MAGPTMFTAIVAEHWRNAFAPLGPHRDQLGAVFLMLFAQIGLITPAAAQQGLANLPTTPRAPRPAAAPLRVEPPSPQLRTLLVDWYAATKDIKKIEGKHRRWVYDATFGVEKRSEGKYWYQAPDQGRIEITVENDKALLAAPPRKQASGQPYAVKLDRPESWVCDGQTVTQINHALKEYEQIAIPPANRGANIMDGPLPFLLGMPPEKAHARYAIRVLADEASRVILAVTPRLASDQDNWSRAMVILAKPAYLPDAVRIFDPSGNKETTYQFVRRKVNGGNWIEKIWNGNPFAVDLAGYTRVQSEAAVAAAPPRAVEARPAPGPGPNAVVPSVVGLPWPQAKEILQARGYAMSPERGPVAPRGELKYHVESQIPAPRSPLERGQTVRLIIYDAPAGG